MAQIIAQKDARTLGLPGRVSMEIVSEHVGAKSATLRLVEIPVPEPGETLRGPHVHHGFEECMHVVSGSGETHAGGKVHPIGPGDTILVPAEEPHVTRNTGSEPLMLLCFFPVNDIRPGTENLPAED
ncbi:MAG: cupin domain-containing protein [Rhizobiales bacterium]|nr:cupin domain-containing protein [Hyphomicrobiales bacterium]